MNDDRRSPKRVHSIDGFVVRPRQSRYDNYRPLHQVQTHKFLDPKRLRHDSPQTNAAPNQPGKPAAPLYPKAGAALRRARQASPSSVSPVAAPSPAPAAQAVRDYAATTPLSDRYRPRDRSRAQVEGTNLAALSTTHKETKPKKKRQSLKHWLTTWNRRKIIKVSLLTILLAILVGGAWLGWKLYRDAAKVTHNNNPFSLLGAFKPVPLKNQNGQVNVLLAGDSADDPGHDGADLTDSIMVMSINTKTHQASMLSIPRDLWVEIPGMGHQKINAANTATNFSASGFPSGGMGQLEQIVSQNLGITLDYYALINYTAFRDAVNAVGGITINIQSSDPRGLYDSNANLKLPNGPVTLNGQEALNLARARGDGYGAYGFPNNDYDRTMHQRQLLLAIKDKATSASVLSNPLKIGQLADALGNNVQTDLKINELESFYSYTKNITDANTLSYNLNNLVKGQMLLKNYTADNGQEALIPAAGLDDFSDIQTAVAKLFSNNPIVKEGAQVVVLNGGNITGLAGKEETVLKGKNINVVSIADAPKLYPKTEIIDNSNGAMPKTKQALEKQFGTNVVTSDPSVTGYTADFIVVLGENQAAPGGSANTATSNPSASAGD